MALYWAIFFKYKVFALLFFQNFCVVLMENSQKDELYEIKNSLILG